MPSEGQHLVLFDGVCNLCNGFVQFIIKRDPQARFKFAALQSNTGRKVLTNNGYDVQALESVVYVTSDGVFTRSTAALQILKDLGRPWSLLTSFLIIPAFIRNAVYDFIAKYRYRFFGKKAECMVPTQALKARFLD